MRLATCGHAQGLQGSDIWDDGLHAQQMRLRELHTKHGAT